MKGEGKEIKLQVGLNATTTNSTITLEAALFSGASSKDLLEAEIAAFVKDVTDISTGASNAVAKLTNLDKAITKVSDRQTTIGSAQNKVDSAISAITVQSENLTSSLSTIRDADVAEESSSYIKAQILQQASATLLATANQAPSIALNLI